MVRITTTKEKYQEILDYGGKKAIVHFMPEEKDGLVECYEMSVDKSDYSRAVSALIKALYPADVMDAVRNNMDAVRDGLIIDEAKASEYRETYFNMQTWRQNAKRIAKEVCREE